MRARIVLVLCLVLVCYVALYGVVFNEVVYPRFAELERDQAVENVARCVDVLRREARRLSSVCAGLGSLEAAGGLEAAFAGGLGPVLAGDSARLAAWGRPGGPVQARLIPPARKGSASRSEEAIPAGFERLLALAPERPEAEGFAVQEGRPVLASLRLAPGAGGDTAVLLAQALDEALLQALSLETRIPFDLVSAGSGDLSPLDREALAALTPGRETWLRAQDGVIHAYTLLPALEAGAPGLLLRASFPETISRRGRAASRMGVASGVMAGALILLALLAVLDAQIAAPLERFTRHVRRVRQERALDARIGSPRRDEIGLLGREFDAMLAEIQSLHHDLEHQAYRLGMAEAASGVLHELRNALAPLPGLLESQRLQTLNVPWDNLERAAGELGAETGPGSVSGSARREDLSGYLLLGLSRIRAALDGSAQGARRLGELFVRVEAILLAYDEMALGARRVEPLDLAPAVLAAAAGLPKALGERLDLNLDPSLERAPRVLGNVQGVRLVVEALLALGVGGVPGQGRVRVAVEAQSLAWRGRPAVRVRLRVAGGVLDVAGLSGPFSRDRGVKGQHRGVFGPHWCANAMNAMGGAIEAAGAGEDAGFDLVWPAAPGTGDGHAH